MIHPLLSHLDHEEYRTYQINVARKLGSINAAIFLSDLISSFKHYIKQKTIIYSKEHQDYVLFYTHECCTERTVLSRKEQDSAIKLLQELNLIKKFVAGVHGKRHFKINQRELINFLYGDSIKEYEVVQNGQGTLSKTDNVPCPKRTKTYKNIKEEHKERKQQQEASPPVPAKPDVPTTSGCCSSSIKENKKASKPKKDVSEDKDIDEKLSLLMKCGLSHSESLRLTHHEIDDISLACDAFDQYSANKTVFEKAALMTSLINRKAKPSKKKAEIVKSSLEKYQHLDGKLFGIIRVYVLKDTIQFCYPQGAKIFKAEDPNFESDVEKYLESCRNMK